MIDAAAAGYSLVAAISAPINAARKMEDALTDLGDKAGMNAGQLSEFGAMARRVAPQVNQFATDLVVGADFLAGMGLSLEKTTAAIPAIGKAATATRASIEDLAVASFAAIDNLKVSAEQTADALDIMAYAGKEGGFELKDMAKDFPSLTSTIQAYGSTGLRAVSDLAAGLQIVRKGAGSASEAATNMANLLQKIGSPGTARRFKALGIDLRTEMKKAQEAGQSPIETILKLTDKALNGDLSKLGDIFEDAEVQKAVRPLLQNLQEYIDLRERSMTSSKGTVDDSFIRQMNTAREASKAFWIQIDNISGAIGNALIPALLALSKAIAPYAAALSDMAAAHPEAVQAIVATVGALAGLRIATTAARWGFLFLKGGALQAALGAATAAQATGKLAGFLFLSRTATRKAAVESVALAAAQARGTQRAFEMARSAYQVARSGNVAGTSLRAAGQAMGEAAAAATAARQRLAAANTALAMTGRIATLVSRGGMIGGIVSVLAGAGSMIAGVATAIVGALATVSAPVWATVAAVAAVGLAVYRYWEPISNFVSGFAEGIGAAIGPMVDMLANGAARIAEAVGGWAKQKLIDFAGLLGIDEGTVNATIANAVTMVQNLGNQIVAVVKAIPSAVSGWIGEMFSMKDYSAEAEASFREAGRNAGLALVNAIKDAVGGLMDWFSGLAGRIRAAIGSVDLKGIIKWPSMPWPFGGGPAAEAAEKAKAVNDNAASAAAAAAPVISGARAAGGPVVGGRTYLVGETGRELFTPAEDGYVHDASSTRQMAARPESGLTSRAVGGDVNVRIDMGGVVIRNDADIARIIAEIERKLRDQIDGLQADLGYSVA